MTSVKDVLDEVHARFEAASLHYGHGTDNAWDEAVALVLGVTGLADEAASLALTLDGEQETSIRTLAERRVVERLPLAYLLGEATYCGLTLAVAPGVVVPRSPIGPWLCDGPSPGFAKAPRSILDLCCGSGAIGIVAAHCFPDARVVLCDIDGQALTMARDNVERHGLGGRVTVVCSDLFAALAPAQYDLIVCNPPYVDAADMAARPPEYRHEPDSGLAGGDADGLRIVRRLLAMAGAYLSADGVLVCEVGNSAGHLEAAYPDVPFFWPDLPAGGHGVFVADRELLAALVQNEP